MAPARTPAPRTKRGPQNLTNIGVEGRATGLTVDERPRDENGLEVLENWYSSPAAPQSRHGASNNGTSSSSKDMEIVQSSGPDPADIVRSTKASHGRPSIPRGRSPIKTSLGATPVRGTPRSSTSTAKQNSVENVALKSSKRLLDFSKLESSHNLKPSPSRKSDARPSKAVRHSANGDIFDLPQSPDGSENGSTASAHARRVASEASQIVDALDEAENAVDAAEQAMDDAAEMDASLPPINGDDDSMERGQDEEQSDNEADAAPGTDAEPSANGANRGSDAEAQADTENADASTQPEDAAPKQKGRPRRNQKKPLAENDANKKSKPQIQSRKTRSESQQVATKSVPGPRATQRVRMQTPLEESSAFQTRFGRNSYKPLAYWRGEKAVFQDGRLGDLDKIVRVEDATPKKLPSQQYKSTRRKKRNRTIFEEEQDSDHEEPWEVSEGVVSAPVRMWDSELGVAPPEDEVEQQLAFASARIQPRASPDNPNFFFTKTLTMPFFGSGVIEIPAGGYKGLKNSRKFQFIFFVHYGKVNVEVAGTPFTITKGGMWQVPRGNFYSIANDTEHPAKIFFAQSCEVVTETVAVAPPPINQMNGEASAA